MLGIVEIPAKAGTSAPYLGRGQSPALSNGVCYHRLKRLRGFDCLNPFLHFRVWGREVTKGKDESGNDDS
jgi:hypothetical protein